MTKPRRSDPDKLEQARRVAAETEQQRDQIILAQAHPGRLVRNPCGDTTCTDCYGSEDEANHVRRTGMMPGEGDPPADRGAGFTPPGRS